MNTPRDTRCSRQALFVGLFSLTIYICSEKYLALVHPYDGWIPTPWSLGSAAGILLACGVMWHHHQNHWLAWGLLHASWYLALFGAVKGIIPEGTSQENPRLAILDLLFCGTDSIRWGLISVTLMSVPVTWFLIIATELRSLRDVRALLPGVLTGLTSCLLFWQLIRLLFLLIGLPSPPNPL